MASLDNYLNYGDYVIKHKYNVLGPGLQLGVNPIRLAMHDWSKLAPTSFVPYTNFFIGPKGLTGSRDKTVWKEWREAVKDHYALEGHHADKIGLTKTVTEELESIADWYSVTKSKADRAGLPCPNFKEWWQQGRTKFKNMLSAQAFQEAELKIAEGKSVWNIFL